MLLNGEKTDPQAFLGKNIDAMLTYLKLDKRHVAVEINAEIIPKAQYESFLLSEDDNVEIIHFVGGG